MINKLNKFKNLINKITFNKLKLILTNNKYGIKIYIIY